NEDDGNLNFDKNKPFANLVKATADLELKWKNFGFFGRGTAFYDFEIMRHDNIGDTAIDRMGKNFQGLDGFVSAAFEPGGKNLRLRAGRQVISWGESTFLPNGINSVNPVDLSKLRVPGSELKEAFLPTNALWANQEITQNLSMEGFYLLNHDKIRIDPRGTYFSNNDFASDDATRVILSFGRRRDQNFPPSNPVPPVVPTLGTIAAALYGPYDPAASVWAPRAPDKPADDNGQYGLALRLLTPDLNNTEFGLYFMNYHSRIPLFSGVKGTPSSILTGGPLIAPICATAALRSLCHTGTATYFAEYPEDIKLYGISFNTAGPAGIALQGEYSYRSNQPVQYATPELLLAALGLPNLITGSTQIPGAPTGVTPAFLVPDGTYLQGYARTKMSQFQMTGTKSIPAFANSDQLVLLGEFGYTWFHNLPNDVKFNGPAVFLPATQLGAIASSAFSVQQEGFLTSTSWGYRLVGRLEYNNALLGGNISPRLAWAHDVRGVGPTFNEGAKSVSVGATWDYQRQWLVDLQYTSYMGGRTYCGTDSSPPPAGSGQSASYCSAAFPLKDRDFYSVSVSYSF
ncbi:MAG: DUF1302 domain-containing protein, partial [Betaproteobacteria bacterium]|nr:DUF1302 domain-containing protein [Betaproteobacteria bacterium]